MEPVGSTSGADRPAAAEDEALKLNTDCVYFLASPLTCKKGSECEYRHSEGARVNPRDCWYWLNGNCLNPKCSFRHPPLDGLYGPPGTTSGLASPLSQAVSSMQIPATHARAYNPNKQSVSCYYFQKGACLKGDMCPFMHGPQTTSSSAPQQVAKVPVSLTEQSQTLKKDSWGLKKCTVQQPKAIVEKPTEVLPPSAEPAVMVDALSNNVLLHQKSLSLYQLENSRPKSQILHVPLSINDAPTVLNNHLPHVSHSSNDVPTVVNNHQVLPVEEHHHSDHEANEFLPESSPGFDVLVDDDRGEDPDYFHNENVNSVTDFEYQHAEYEPFLQFERDRYTEMGGYERDERVRSRRGREQNRRSSEGVLNGRSMDERGALEREETVNEIDGSDLRHRLLKQRRLNDSRSSVKHDHRREPYQGVDRYAEERNRDRNSSRNQHRYPQERSISTRLQGRLTLPRRSSRDNPIEFQSRKERDRERHRRRSSPTPPISNHQGRQHERVKRRVNEEFTTDVRNSDRQPINRDDTELLDFAGPKSLAELKGAKIAERSQDQSIEEQRSMKPMKAMSHHESEESLLFEGPKPLGVILKRKRETELETGALSSFGDENQKKERVDTGDSVSAAASSMCLTQDKNEEDEEEEGLFHAGDEELHNDDPFCAKEELEVEDDTIVETTEEHDLEEHRDEESDYEVMTEGGEFRTEDDNVHRHEEEDFDDDDDDDDFARKIGMILS